MKTVSSLSKTLLPQIKAAIDQKTKPLGALGRLEEVATQIALIQQTIRPEIRHPHVVVFAGDHGLAQEGVSKYPQEVTRQMVLNFLADGAAINVFCRQHGLGLSVVDAGVKAEWDEQTRQHPLLIHQKIGPGTRNAAIEPAMTADECNAAIRAGEAVVAELAAKGTNLIAFGEMGIANTSSAALLMHFLTALPMAECTGRGTGLSQAEWEAKVRKLTQIAATQRKLHANRELGSYPRMLLAAVGGYEIAQMAGAFVEAAAHRMVILVDGFIATAALMVAQQFDPSVTEYCIFCHQSDERGHKRMLDFLQVRPLLSLGLRLGEGTGAALAYPLVASAVAMLNEMASFASAGVSTEHGT